MPIQELIWRIKAALPEWKQFKFTRNDPVAHQLFGDYYIVDLRTHVPTLGKIGKISQGVKRAALEYAHGADQFT